MSVYVWGFGKLGQLGNGQTDTCHTPVTPKLPNKIHAVNVHSGGYYTGVVATDGSLYTFGCGKYGRLGTGDETDRTEPVKVNVKYDNEDVKFKQVSCGIWHGAAISIDNNVYIWGYGKSHGVLGDADIPVGLSPPALLKGPFMNKVAGVSCGNNFTLLWTTDGDAYSWGCGRHGALGHGDADVRHTPTLITKFRQDSVKVNYMDAGFTHCGAVTENGHVYMFGKGEDGALGIGNNPPKQVNLPRRIELLTDQCVKEVSCSVGDKHGHSLFVTDRGVVYACGDGYKGKLGLGDQTSRFIPTPIAADSFSDGEIVAHVSAGGIHSAAVTKQGHAYTWGCGSDGRLGHPDGKGHRYLFRSDIPRVVDSLAKHGNAMTISCSYYHTVARVTVSEGK